MKIFSFLFFTFISTILYAENTKECTKYILNANDIVNVSFCDKNGWCKIKNQKLYIKKFLFNKLSDTQYQVHTNLATRQKTYYYTLDGNVSNKYNQCISKKNKLKPKPINIDLKNNNQIYTNGMNYYNKKDYQKSYKLFSKIYLQKLMDPKFNFYYGYSAYQTQHYEMAIAAFERVEMIDPNNSRVKLEMARVYFLLEMYNDAELKFKEVLQNPSIPQNVKTNVELYLSEINNLSNKAFIYSTINFDFFYDSNINYGSISDTYNIGDNIFPTPNKISDSGLQLSGDLTYLYDIGDKNDFIIKNKILLFTKRHNKNSDYDINYLVYNPSILYKKNNYITEVELGIDTLSVAQKSYMKSLSLKSNFEFMHTDSLKSLAYLKIIDKYFKDETLDAYQYELNYGLQNILTPYSYISANITYIGQKKKKKDRIDIDYDEYKFNIDYANQFTKTYALVLSVELKKRDYDDYSELLASTRSDKSGTISTTFSIELYKSIKLNIKGLYNRVNSNQKIFSYEKNTISLGIVKTF